MKTLILIILFSNFIIAQKSPSYILHYKPIGYYNDTGWVKDITAAKKMKYSLAKHLMYKYCRGDISIEINSKTENLCTNFAIERCIENKLRKEK
jgi:hypothetical protein